MSRPRCLVDHVRAWRAEGIDVVACRPPASAARRGLEDTMPDDRDADIVACLRGASTRRVHVGEHATYEGSHLDEMRELDWAQELAERIARGEDEDLGGACPAAFTSRVRCGSRSARGCRIPG